MISFSNDEKTFRIWSYLNKKCTDIIKIEDRIKKLMYLGDNRIMYVIIIIILLNYIFKSSSGTNFATIYDISQKKVLFQYIPHLSGTVDWLYLNDSSSIISFGNDKLIRIM